MTKAGGLLWLTPLIALLSGAGGCSSTRAVDNGAAESARTVEVGDTVRIVTHAGQKIELEVAEVDSDTLTGTRGNKTGQALTGYEVDPADSDSAKQMLRVPLDDVASTQKREPDGWKMVAVVGSTVAVYWLIDVLLTTFLIALAF